MLNFKKEGGNDNKRWAAEMVHLYDQKITLQTLYHNPTQSLFQKMLLDEVPPADIAEYAVCSDKKLANRGPSASVIEYKLRTSSGDSLESIDQPHASLLKYKTNKGLDLDKMVCWMVLSAIVPETGLKSKINCWKKATKVTKNHARVSETRAKFDSATVFKFWRNVFHFTGFNIFLSSCQRIVFEKLYWYSYRSKNQL